MALPSKENFRLLDMSSDEESEDLQLEIIPSRKKKVTRRDRSRLPPVRTTEPNMAAELRCAFGWAMRGTLLLWLVMLTWICAALYDQVSVMRLDVAKGTLLLWLVMLTWICAALYDQVSVMRLDVAKVSTSSDSVGDALQVCHTAAKELRANASSLNSRLTKLEHDHLDLAKRVEQAIAELATVSGQLAAAPELREMPKRLSDLQRTVAELGSQINGFDGAINTARKQAVTAATGVEEVKTLLHQLEGRTNDTIANVTANVKRDDDIRSQVIALNSTLEAKVEALRVKIDQISRPVTTPPPPPSTSSTTTSTTPTTSTISSTSTTTTTTIPPGPPAKPSVLQ